MQQPSSSSSSNTSDARDIQLSLHTDRTLLRGPARSTRYLLITLTAPTAPAHDNRIPLNVGIVLDRSGSMDGHRKFSLAYEAVKQSLAMLRASDRFSLVVFDTEIDVLAPHTLGNGKSTRVALQRLKEIQPRGGTDLYGGWMTGASQLLSHKAPQAREESVDRVLLLTDGQANHGVTEPSALKTAAGDLRWRGVPTTTFGVGDDFDERLLRDIAREGGGQFYYIETPAQIADMLTSELGDALEVVRRDASVRIDLPPGARAELLNEYRTTHEANDEVLFVHVGDLTSAQELQLVVRLTFPEDRLETTTAVRVSDVADTTTETVATHELTWQYAGHATNDVQPRNVLVDREVAELYAARARLQASEFNRKGEYKRARRVLEATANRIKSYANGDAELEQLWRALLSEVEMYAERGMSVVELKQSVFAYENRSKNRDTLGKVRKQRAVE